MLGLDPDLFWRSTPREVEIIAAGVNERLRQQHNQAMRAAYVSAAVIMVAKRPPLDDYLIAAPKGKGRSPQTWQQQIAIALQWTAATAGRK